MRKTLETQENKKLIQDFVESLYTSMCKDQW